MNWKIWRWPRQKRMAQSHLREVGDALAKSLAEVKRLEMALVFRRKLENPFLNEHSIAHALMFVDSDDAQWLAINRLLAIMDHEEQALALRPSMDSGERAYNNGRAAAVADVRAMLLQQWTKARAI